jgi:hypothetical protein
LIGGINSAAVVADAVAIAAANIVEFVARPVADRDKLAWH